MDPTKLTIQDVLALLKARKVSAREIADSCYRVIEAKKDLGAFLTLSPERAYAQAERVDRMIAAGEDLPPLAGVPVAVKDVLVTKGLRTTAGSRILENYVPQYDATSVERLERAGAVVLGKTNCDEFAMGSSNENSAYFPAHNPHDPTRVPGGSSGGSAVATAAGMCVAALGTDTGGSIRQPAALCGIVGMMGTYGRVSRYGLIAFASSLDHPGPFARTVRDAARMMRVIAGRDPLDSTSADVPVPDYEALLDQPVNGWKVGVPKEYFGAGLDPEMGANLKRGIQKLEALGSKILEIRLPHTEYAIATYYIIATAEASSNLARYDGVRYGLRVPEGELRSMYKATRGKGFGAEVKRRIMLGTYALSAGYYDAYYLKAQKVRTLIARDFHEAFRTVDVIVTPTSPFPAFRLGEKTSDPLQMYLADIYTVTADLVGVPAISIPCGWTKKPRQLPVGLQIFAPAFEEARIFQIAHHFQLAGGFDLA
jgi:aspartyl-tRNA(Asn)/glutamyl-tRNA(Gln) amidotransferase subunit A